MSGFKIHSELNSLFIRTLSVNTISTTKVNLISATEPSNDNQKGVIYMDISTGKLTYKGTSGTITVLANS